MHTPLLKIGLGLTLGLAALSGCSHNPKPYQPVAGDYEGLRQHLGKEIRETMRSEGIVGLSIALVSGQRTIWSTGFGVADKDGKLAATDRTRYRAGGLSTLLTAAAAARQHALGNWDLDRPLADYLSEFKPSSRFPDHPAITPRMLLTHHAGLPQDRLQGLSALPPEDFSRLAALSKDTALAAPPGAYFAYSNLGYSLAGTALERVSGEDFETHLQKALLQPAGMRDSEFSAHAPQGEHAAPAYKPGAKPAQEPYPMRDIPALGLNTSSGDLAAYLQLLFRDGYTGNRAILPASAVKALWQTQNPSTLDMDLRTGLGWLEREMPMAGRVLQMGGALQNHRSYIAVMPEEQLGVVILSNTGFDFEALTQLGWESLARLWETKHCVRLPQEPAPAKMPRQYLADLDKVAGDYSTAYGYARVRRHKDYLLVDLEGESLELQPLSAGRFSLRKRLLGLYPMELEQFNLGLMRHDGRDLLLIQSDDDHRLLLVGERLPKMPIPAAWQARVGEYRILNPRGLLRSWSESGRILARIRDGRLLVISDGEGARETLVLTPLSDTEAVVAGIGSGAGDRVQVSVRGDREFIQYSGLTLQKTTDAFLE